MQQRQLAMVLVACLGWGLACGAPENLEPFQRQAQVDREVLELGATDPGVMVSGVVRLRNQGEGTVRAELTLAPADGPFFLTSRLYSADSSWTDVSVRMLSLAPGEYNGELLLHTNSSTTRDLKVRLHGTVRSPPDCDDGNPCTLDLLEGRECEHVSIRGACSDGDACTVEDQCVDGRCVGARRDCSDGVECTVDTCDGVMGCIHSPRHENCDDGNPCSADTCLPIRGCEHVTSPNGTLCGVPECAHLPLCVDGNCRSTRAPDGFPCEDGNPCSLGDYCVQGECKRGLGEDLGTSDPVVLGVGMQAPVGVAVEPVEVGGLQALGEGRVRVAWRSAPRGWEACPNGSCDPSQTICTELRSTHGGFAVHVTEVDDHGTVHQQVELPPPAPGMAAVAVRAVPHQEDLVVLAQFRSRPGCCPTLVCPEDSPVNSSALYRVHGSSVEGPVVLAQSQDVAADGHRLPIALDVHGDVALALVSHALVEPCSGECPVMLSMGVWRVDLGSHPPAVGSGASVVVEAAPLAAGLAGVEGVDLAVHGDDMVLVWRTVESPAPWGPACGEVSGERWRGAVWQGGMDSVVQPQDVEVIGADPWSVRGISVSASALGPVVFVANQRVNQEDCMCSEDGGCMNPQCARCVVEDRVEAWQGSQRPVMLEQTAEQGISVVTTLGSGAAFGRAVGVALLSNGEAELFGPTFGAMPPIQARFAPPPELPVHLVAGTTPHLAQDEMTAWLAALLRIETGAEADRTHAVAVVHAGCGLRSTGRIWGWPPPVTDGGAGDDGGVPVGPIVLGGADGGRWPIDPPPWHP